LKKHEDHLKIIEEDKKRQRRYEEDIRSGKIKKIGRKKKVCFFFLKEFILFF
jgi:hypothetical protein